MDTESKKRFLLNTAFFAVSAALIYLVAKFLLSYLFPFVIGVISAVILQKPARRISNRLNLDTGVCAAFLTAVTYISAIVLLIIIFRILWMHLPDFSRYITENPKGLKSILEAQRNGLEEKISRLPSGIAKALQNLSETSLSDVVSNVGEGISKVTTNIAKRFPSFLISITVTFAASCYIAKDFERLTLFFKDILSAKTVGNIITVRDILFNRVFKLFAGYLLLALITFGELAVGLRILKIQHFLPIAAIIAAVDLLPILGTGTVLIPWAVICLISGNIRHGIGLSVLYVFITVIRNFTEPRIIGKKMGISPLLTLITMFFGLRIAGVAGMFIMPLTLITVIDFYKKQSV